MRLLTCRRGQKPPSLAREQGQALLEFALVLPVLVLIVLAVVDVGKALNYWNDQTHLASEGARYAAVNSCSACGGQKLNDWLLTQVDSNELRNGSDSVTTPVSVCIFFPNVTHAVGDPVKVVVTSRYKWLGYLKLSPATATLRATSTMRIESAPTDPTNPASSDAYKSSASCP